MNNQSRPGLVPGMMPFLAFFRNESPVILSNAAASERLSVSTSCIVFILLVTNQLLMLLSEAETMTLAGRTPAYKCLDACHTHNSMPPYRTTR